MALSGILETVLYASDLDAMEAFYGDVLGLRLHSKVPQRHVFYAIGTQMLLIFNPEATRTPAKAGAIAVPLHGMTGEGHVCFRTSAGEIEGWRGRLVRAGVAIEADFEWPGGGRSIYFRDPAGNSLEFAEPRIWGFSE